MSLSIAIDGPVAAGKTSVSDAMAEVVPFGQSSSLNAKLTNELNIVQ